MTRIEVFGMPDAISGTRPQNFSQLANPSGE
jgi:hypothetical protein